MKRKYLLLLLVALAMALGGCPCDKKYVAPPPEPGAPTNLTATAVSYKQIHLSWQDNSEDEDYFRVCCPTMFGTQHATLATLPANSTSYDHRNLELLKEYEYYVCAHRGEERTCSNRAYATTLSGIEILDWNLSVTSSATWLDVQIQNQTDKILTYFTIVAWLYDVNGTLLDSIPLEHNGFTPMQPSEIRLFGFFLGGREMGEQIDDIVLEVTSVEYI